MSTPDATVPTVVGIDHEDLQHAFDEIARNKEVYTDLVKELSSRNRSAVGVIQNLIPVSQEVIRDYKAVAPAVTEIVKEIKAGVNTSEYKMASGVNKLLMFITLLAPALDAASSYFQHTTFGSSLWVTALGMLAKAAVTVNYTSARAKVKSA